MSIRGKFVKRFGEEQAVALERAAEGHANGPNSECRGSDPFKWVLCIVIGYQCAEKDAYRDHHGITVPWAKLKSWIKKHGELATHDGDSDYLALMAGVYNEYMPSENPR